MTDYEKLGAFYLGRVHDLATGEPRPEPLLYDSKDLTTHAVCVGMTGSGKTGLCLSLIEEAAIDGVPVIAIDPKVDLGNLMLTFPDLQPSDFRPWVDETVATRKGKTPDEFAASTAKLWRDGLASWDQDGERIRKFRDAVEIAIYTPGGSAGLPITVLKSFSAPSAEVLADRDAMRERVASSASGVLALLGIDADPIKSREHILLSTLLDRAWREGRDLDIASLIQEIQSPPIERIGVLDLDTFFPPKDRIELAMELNNLLASPSFAAWMEGEPLDIKRLFYTADGKPRISILSIAHLSDDERMFFVTILLGEVLAWMRSQPGTSSLRALLYMDEVYGYFPPTANPPSKRPMLTLLKQARAFGLGVVLSTQNPVDLDYKGLSNAGTWFLGRLQTERDKMRVLEGLEGASAQAGSNFDKQQMEATLAGLGSRVFLMNNVHEDEPAVFHTRWALSYLRGPLTRSQIGTLMKEWKAASGSPESDAVVTAMTPRAVPSAPPAAEKKTVRRKTATARASADSSRPVLPNSIDEIFIARRFAMDDDSELVYRPGLLGATRLHFARVTYKLDAWRDYTLVDVFHDGQMPDRLWSTAMAFDRVLDTADSPELGASFAPLPHELTKARGYKSFGTKLKDFLYRNEELLVFRCKTLKAYSAETEALDDFKIRLSQLAREKRDLAVEKLSTKHATKFGKLKDRIDRAEKTLEKEETQYSKAKADTVVSLGESILGALFGRKLRSRTNVTRASRSAKGLGKAAKERSDVKQAEAELVELQERLAESEARFKEEIADLSDIIRIDQMEIETLPVRPRKTDIEIGRLSLVWLPWVVDADGNAEPAW